MARRFDADTNEVSGDPVPVIDKVEYNVAAWVSYGYNFDTHDGTQLLVNCAVDLPGHSSFCELAADEGPIADDARYYFPPRLLIPCASIWTLKTVPPPTTYSVFISGPAKARFCGLRDGVMEPRYAPCGVNT